MTTPDTPTPGELAAVDRRAGLDLAARLTELFADAERRLAADIARRLAAGMDRPDWAAQKLMALGDLRRFTRTLTERLGRDTRYELTQALMLAYARSGTDAIRALGRAQNTLPEWLDLAGINDPGPRIMAALNGKRVDIARRLTEISRAFPGVANVMRMVASLALRISGTHLPILRWAEDAYREVIAATNPGVLMGLDTRRRASQIAWERLLSRGITGFTDRSGRHWNLASYVEMATRTGTAQAAVEGHLDRLSDVGIDLVIVSNAPQECKRCRPWEGKILARSGSEGRRTIQVVNAVTGAAETVEIWGTVDEAIRAGLLHPNCRHSLSAYLHGATKVPTHTEDPEGDRARQRLRELERAVRREKLQAQAAIDPAATQGHERKVRELQADIREHVATHTHLGIFRKPERERIGAAR